MSSAALSAAEAGTARERHQLAKVQLYGEAKCCSQGALRAGVWCTACRLTEVMHAVVHMQFSDAIAATADMGCFDCDGNAPR